MSGLSCTRCLTKGHACPATTEDDNGIPICVFCADGVACPASSFRKPGSAEAAEVRRAMVLTRKCEDCGKDYTPTGNRQVRCEDCRQKLKESARPKPKRKAPVKLEVKQIGSERPVTVSVEVTEKHLDGFWAGLTIEAKARLFSHYLG